MQATTAASSLLRSPVAVCPGSGDYVVLLHGLWRTRRSLDKVGRALSDKGFHTVSIGYPSQFRRVESIVREHVIPAVAEHCPDPDRRIHFVTHSLGAIVARTLLASHCPPNVGRCVFLAPPNRGSRIVDWLLGHEVLRKPFGPVAEELHTGADSVAVAPGAAQVPTRIIMGDKVLVPFFQPLLPGANDGIVEVSAGQLEGADPSIVVHADHTTIMRHPEAIRLVREFLLAEEEPS